MNSFYHPTQEHLAKLSGPWCCSYSGGKDSTSLVTWIEWLRRSGWITVDRPQLVRSDTGVEDPVLVATAEKMTDVLARSGWECVTVRPEVHERLYPQILGRGLPPIHPGISHMRWCTRSTKIDPMNRLRKWMASGLVLTGLRLGESAMRDGKLKRKGCSAGGECGIPDPTEKTYSPILNWTTCQVIDWLRGLVDSRVGDVMGDVFQVTQELVEVYGVVIRQTGFEWSEPEIQTGRFGCIGCPAIGAEAHAPKSVIRRNGAGSPLSELYDVWYEARRPENRLVNMKRGRSGKPGPIRMAARKRLFARVMDIQRRSGVTLITPKDEEFIRQCWADKVYPRGWSEVDELTEAPTDTPLFERRDGR